MSTEEEREFLEVVKRNDTDAIAQFLKEKDITEYNHFGHQTAAHIAVENGNVPVLELLFEKDRFLPEAKDNMHRNLLYIALKNGSFHIVKYLIQYYNRHGGSWPNPVRNCSLENTVIQVAAQENKLQMLKWLLKHTHFGVDHRNPRGETALFQAVEAQQMRIVKYLVEMAGATANLTDDGGNNVLYGSVKSGHGLTMPKYLLDEKRIKIDINWTNKAGQTLLHWTARYNRLDFMKYLIEKKQAKTNITSKLGWTVMHEAVSEGHIDIIRYLVRKGARTDLKDISGRMPVDLAMDKEVIECLNDVPKSRVSRSALNYQYSPVLMLNVHPAPENWITSLRGLQNQHSEQTSAINFSHLGSLLLLANTMMRQSKQSNKLPSQLSYVSSWTEDIALNANWD